MGNPIIGALISPLALWIAQQDPITSPNATLLDQLPNYGLAGLIVGLVIWGLNYFNKREDRSEAVHKTELDELRGDMDILRQELGNERIERRRQEISYLDQIGKLQNEITDLKVKLAKAEERISKNQDSINRRMPPL